MDFFDRQERARKHTKLLEVYFGLAILGISSAIYFVVVLVLQWWPGRGYRNYEYDSCLLYTSPSPRDLSTSRMPSSA